MASSNNMLYLSRSKIVGGFANCYDKEIPFSGVFDVHKISGALIKKGYKVLTIQKIDDNTLKVRCRKS